MNVLMIGVDEKTKGGMWTVAKHYLSDTYLSREIRLKYIATATAGSKVNKILHFLRAMFDILFELLFHQWDIVHVHMAERGSFYRKRIVIAVSRLLGRRVVLHMHGAEFETWYHSLPDKRKHLVEKCLNEADCILILGEYWRSFIASLIKDPQKITVLYNAVHVPGENRYSPGAQHLLFLGEVGQRKGIYDLLTALTLIDPALPKENTLLIFGPNPDGDICERINHLGLNGRVRYMGWLDEGRKAEIFSKTAVNILPSYHEGLPMAILESMAHGIPNIATNVGAIPEAIHDNNGAIIAPGDRRALAEQILHLVLNDAKRMEKSHRAHQTALQRFSMEHHAVQLVNVYRSLLK